MENQPITPSTNPESFATFVFLAEGEVFGFMQTPLVAEAMVAGMRSGNINVVEIPTGSQIPSILSTWDGENFIEPTGE